MQSFIVALIIFGGLHMVPYQRQSLTQLSEKQIAEVKAEVKQAATDHLHAKDATTALSHFAEDAIAVSNAKLFSSFKMLSEDVKAYYGILKEVNLAVWDEMYIHVINTDAALVTAKFRYSFTDTSNEITDLQGVWSALYVRKHNGVWKIQHRHETFVTSANDGE
ncbi:MAG: hypothetical protein GWN00_33335 [Aliifodinibius sp.]|nr:hypothetical protein [Fodinibius sp.]NIV15652.1 hypothetical protein [Fodinibius sp.]NIY29499.1 hypothetical protein [Fodinibius sp.]